MKLNQIIKSKAFLIGIFAAIGKLLLDYLTIKTLPDVGTIILFVGITGLVGLYILNKKPSPIKAALVGAIGLITYNYIASIMLGVSFVVNTSLLAGIETAAIAFLVYSIFYKRLKK